MYKTFHRLHLILFYSIILLTKVGFANNIDFSFFIPTNVNDTIIVNETIIISDTIIRPVETITLSDSIVHTEIKEINDTIPLSTPEASDTIPQLNDTLDLPPTRAPRPPIAVPGQVADLDDDLPESAIKWYTEDDLQNPFALKPNFADTTLLGFQMYDFASQSGYLFAQKSNVGHTHRQLRFSPDLSPGIKLNEYKLYGDYLFQHDHIRYYRPKHVFTELFYVTGTGREQLFLGKHNQKMHETLHLGVQYRIVNSPGPVSRSGARNSNFYFTADYLSSDNRYQALGSFIVNRVRNQESGGLRNHLRYEEEQVADSVFLYRAESWARDLSVNIRHFYQTGFYTAADTSKESRFINLGRINHNFTYKRTSFVMDDKDRPLLWYDFPKMDSISTFDSTVVHRLENLISWSNFPLTSGRGTFPFNFTLYVKHSINTIQQTDQRPAEAPILTAEGERIYYHMKDNFNELVQGFELQSDQRRLVSFGGYANMTLGGYHDEDLHAGTFLNLGRAERSYNLELRLRYSLTEAPYFLNHMSVNSIRWENDFDKMQIINLRARLRFPMLTLEGNYYLLDKMVYLGKEALPVQNSAELGFFSLGAYSDLKAGNFGFRNHVLLQQSSSANFETFPTLVSYHSVFFNLPLFDNALINQAGFDFHFNTGYNAMAYMPVVRSFYLQDEHQIADKYLLDIFWNGKISNARLFVKYQNILGLIINNRIHYDIPFYPIPESMFKFGVSWMFFN